MQALIKPLVWLGALAPLALIVVGIFELAGQSLGPNPIREILHVTGKTSLNLLLITLCATPLRELTGQTWWVRPRRLLGLMAFSYALLHFLVYAVLELELQLGELGRELARRPYILVGTVALLALIPLAITSTDRMMRRLGRRWQRLHRLIYPITALGIWHYYWQVKADIREPLIYLGLLAVLLAWRARSAWLRRKSRQVPAASPR
jgi:sulfoxide reductase heme-binding subunit YedZ